MGVGGSQNTRPAAAGIFKNCDKNCNGELTIEELKAYFNLSQVKASEIMTKFAKVKPNVSLTKREFANAVESLFYEDFRKFDRDGDGYISLEDAIRYYTKEIDLDGTVPVKDKDKELVKRVKALMMLDQGDGKVSFQEFVEGKMRD